MSRAELFSAYLDALVAAGAITQAAADEVRRRHPDGDPQAGTLTAESVEFLRDSLAAKYMTAVLDDGRIISLGDAFRGGDVPPVDPGDVAEGDDGPVTYHVHKGGVGAPAAESDRIV
jgi:hypothetical protein